MIQYDDYEQIASKYKKLMMYTLFIVKNLLVADLPGLIPDSHKNKGLGIQFLRHAERCSGLLYILDVSLSEPWEHLTTLQYELSQFSSTLLERPQIIVANKIDVPNSSDNVEVLKSRTNLKVIPVSAKFGMHITNLLQEIRIIFDNHKKDI